MEIEEGMRRKIVLSVAAVVLLIASFVAVGSTFGGNALTETGGIALLGVLVGFILLMGALGVYFARQD